MARSRYIDPTPNVIALVKSGLEAESRLRNQASKALQREIKLEGKHAAELRKAESERLNAVLSGIIATAQRANDTLIETAKTVASETEKTRTAFESALESKLSPINIRLTELSDARYVNVGAKEATVETKDGRSSSQNRLLAFGLLVVSIVAFAAPHIHFH